MSQTAEDFRALKRLEQAERSAHRDEHTRRLKALQKAGHVRLHWFTRDHVRITVPGRRGLQTDFWPATARWRVLGTSGRASEGWGELMEFLEVPFGAREGL